MSIRVFLIEDHLMVADALADAIAQTPDMELVAHAASVVDVAAAPAVAVDVILTDLELPDGDGLDAAGRLRAHTGAGILVMTGYGDRQGINEAVRRGADGFVSKTAPMAEVLAAMRAVANGNSTFPAEILRDALDPGRAPPNPELTARELDVLELLADGLPATEIAAELNISIHTVRNHIRSIMAKLEATTQLQAVMHAFQYGILRPPRPT